MRTITATIAGITTTATLTGRNVWEKGNISRTYFEIETVGDRSFGKAYTVQSGRATAGDFAIETDIGTVYLSIQRPNFDNIGASNPNGSAWTAGLRYADHGSVPKLIHAAGGRIWSAFHGDLDAPQVSQAKALGLTVLAWTVNEPTRMAQVMDMGVDGIVTDRPDLLRQVMARRGLPLPRPTPVQAD